MLETLPERVRLAGALLSDGLCFPFLASLWLKPKSTAPLDPTLVNFRPCNPSLLSPLVMRILYRPAVLTVPQTTTPPNITGFEQVIHRHHALKRLVATETKLLHNIPRGWFRVARQTVSRGSDDCHLPLRTFHGCSVQTISGLAGPLFFPLHSLRHEGYRTWMLCSRVGPRHVPPTITTCDPRKKPLAPRPENTHDARAVHLLEGHDEVFDGPPRQLDVGAIPMSFEFARCAPVVTSHIDWS